MNERTDSGRKGTRNFRVLLTLKGTGMRRGTTSALFDFFFLSFQEDNTSSEAKYVRLIPECLIR
jgi:hypothetical protein